LKKIPLTQGYYALVDDDMFDYLNQWKWCVLTSKAKNAFYAKRTIKVNRKQKTVLMHKLIMQCVGNNRIDHEDGNGLNNQRYNMRFCTISQNNMNSAKPKNASSIWKGVYWDKANLNWRAQIKINKKAICLGRFKDEHSAAIVYNHKAIELFGEFAKLNQL